MNDLPSDERRHHMTLISAAVRGVASGAARAVVDWLIRQFCDWS